MKFRRTNVALVLLQIALLSGSGALAADTVDSTVKESGSSTGSTGSSTGSTGTSTSSGNSVSDATAAKTTPRSDDDEVKIPKNFIHSSTVVSSTNCKIKCLDPHAATAESADVIDILQKIYKAYTEKDLDYIGNHLAQDCITFYEGDKKVISGKKAALDDIKEWTDKESKNVDTPLVEIILEHPYCNINQDHAVITFTAIKEVGGKHPSKAKSHCNDVFKKEGDTWLLLTHYRSNWKEI